MKTKQHEWWQLQSKRTSDIACILGSGSSINTITTKEWKVLRRRCDTWALNNWVYHPFFVPTFYMIEVKWYGFEIMKRRLKEKQEQYQNVCFVFQHNKSIKMRDHTSRRMREVVFPNASVYEYSIKSRDPRRTHPVKTADYKFDTYNITKSYQSTLTCLLEMVWRLGYKVIVLFGVDLRNSWYFWSSGDPKYGEVHHYTNKEHMEKDPREPHATAVIADFIVDFARRMERAGHNMFVGKDSTLLYPAIPLVEWRSIL